ncbi:homoserine dehydrogenase [Orrella sp. 11846]|uniref:homoserine dehydrogenase n=1 Tax=Orrella sp. 11846 TaxID=3409913 RepID=UPI003B58E5D1
MEAIRVGLLGLGVVGGGTWKVLRRNAQEITRRAGRAIDVVQIATRNVEEAKQRVGANIPVTTDAFEVVRNPEIDIVVELIGGIEPARALVLEAIAHGKHVVTANKALLALHGTEIFEAASKKGVMVAFEAAVAGGIPIIKAIREGLTANHIEWVAGIINGTTNYILTEMRTNQLSFAQALEQAQALGYAEADPTADVEGIDAAHKLTLLAAMAFGIPVQFDKAYVEGISRLSDEDIEMAQSLGYRIKLLGITRRREQGIELRVHPTLVPAESMLANVENAMNAVLVNGDAVGQTLYYGQGAGEEPTASAVVADLVDVTRLHTADPEQRVPHLAFQPQAIADTPILPMDDVWCACYLRMTVKDEPGVLAEIARELSTAGVSIGSMIQQPCDEEGSAQLVFLTHEAFERSVNQAIAAIEKLPFMQSEITRLRVETF